MNKDQLPHPRQYAAETFFNLLLSGYATGDAPECIARFEGDPGTKRNIWKDSTGWLGIDEWRTSSLGDGSNGTTSIYYNRVLVWEMQYGGSYPGRVIPFLRKALLLNYRQRIWVGGRGPEHFSAGNFRYTNEILDNSDFARFNGVESIEEYTDGYWQQIGFHQYCGGFLY